MIANLNVKTLMAEWFKAARCNYPHRLKKLSKVARFDHNAMDSDGQTALHLAARYNAAHNIECLLRMPDVRVNEANKDGLLPLFEAAGHGALEAALPLLADGRVESQPADRALLNNFCRAAVEAGDSQAGRNIRSLLSELLRTNGVDVNKIDEDGDLPLFNAAWKGRDECVKLLLSDSRVDVNWSNDQGMTSLHAAAYSGHDACVKLLMADKRVDVNKTDDDGWTPLYTAANEGWD